MYSGRKIILAALSLLFLPSSVIGANETCSGGQEKTIGFLRYVCAQDGKSLKPVGCVTEDGQNIGIGEVLKTDWFIIKCEMVSETEAQMSAVGCIIGGNEVEEGEVELYGHFFYECKTRKSGLSISAIGCQDYEGAMVPVGGTFFDDDFKFECFVDKEKIYAKGVACLVGESEVEVHKKYMDGGFMYHCARSDDYGIKSTVIGCLGDNDVLVKPGETFIKSGFVYKCDEEKSDDDSFMSYALSGCVGVDESGVEKNFSFGDTWLMPLNDRKYKYVMECKGDAENAEKVPIRCGVDKDGQTLQADIGCGIQYSDQQIFICKEENEGFVEMRLLSFKKSFTLAEVVEKYGVKACEVIHS